MKAFWLKRERKRGNRSQFAKFSAIFTKNQNREFRQMIRNENEIEEMGYLKNEP